MVLPKVIPLSAFTVLGAWELRGFFRKLYIRPIGSFNKKCYFICSSNADQVPGEGPEILAEGGGEPEQGGRVDREARRTDRRRLRSLLLRRRRQHLRHQNL
jgi:hypothetical protein